MAVNFFKYENLYKYGLLAVLVFNGVGMGLWQEILVPTLPNLRDKINVTYNTMGNVMSLRIVGTIGSLFITSILYDSYPFTVHYLMFVEIILASLVILAIPWSPNIGMLIPLLLIEAGSINSLNNGGQLNILKVFQDRSIAMMQIYHLGYGVGGLLSGFISVPFLPTKVSQTFKLTKYCARQDPILHVNSTFDDISNSTITTSEKGRFEYIYLISGIIGIVIGFTFLAFKFVPVPNTISFGRRKKESWLKSIHPKYTANGKFYYGLTMTILLFCFYFFYMFGLLTFLPYVVVYAIDPCKSYQMTQKKAAYLHSVLNASFLSGRIINSVLMNFNPTVMIIGLNLFNVLFNLILVFFSSKYELALWIGACGMRLCNSAVFPTGTSYVNRYITVSSSLISIAFLGATTGGAMGQLVGGHLLDSYASYNITYVCCGFMTILFLVTITISILGHHYGVRKLIKQESMDENRKDSIKI